MSLAQFAEVFPTFSIFSLTSGSSTTPQALATSSNQRQRVDRVIATSTAAADRYVSLYYRVGGTSYRLGCSLVPAGAGFAAVPAVDLLAGIPALAGDLFVTSLVGLYAAADVALGAGETITLVGIGGLM